MTRIALLLITTVLLSACSSAPKHTHNGANVVYQPSYDPYYSGYYAPGYYAPGYYRYDSFINRSYFRKPKSYRTRNHNNKYRQGNRNKVKHSNRVKHHNRVRHNNPNRVKNNRVKKNRVLRKVVKRSNTATKSRKNKTRNVRRSHRGSSNREKL